jgi:hypothetical protein
MIRSASSVLRLDHLVDAFLERPPHHELVHLHRPRLPDAVRPVGRLVLDRRVPPPVEVEHVRRRGQVQADAAGLEAEEQDRRRPDLGSWNSSIIF